MTTPREVLDRLHPYEREIFDEIVGMGESRPWGAAVGAARECLVGAGLLVSALHDELTPLGLKCKRVALTLDARTREEDK